MLTELLIILFLTPVVLVLMGYLYGKGSAWVANRGASHDGGDDQ